MAIRQFSPFVKPKIPFFGQWFKPLNILKVFNRPQKVKSIQSKLLA